MSLWTFALSWELWLPWSLIPLGRVVTFPGVLIHPERGETRFSPPPSVVKPGFHLTGRGDGRTTCATGSDKTPSATAVPAPADNAAHAARIQPAPPQKCETPVSLEGAESRVSCPTAAPSAARRGRRDHG